MKFRIFQDSEAASSNAADLIVGLAQRYIEKNGVFVLALSGGTTPRRLYEILGEERFRERCDWDKVHVFQVDERFVPHTHRDSNFRLLNEALFVPASIPKKNIHPVPTGVFSASDSAALYEEEINNFFGGPPVFHCIVLGIGADGHTASLFPGGLSLAEKGHAVLPVKDARYMHPRITLTLPVLTRAENIIFLTTGRKKAAAVQQVIRNQDRALPASLVRPAHGNLYFFLDREAASLLDG